MKNDAEQSKRQVRSSFQSTVLIFSVNIAGVNHREGGGTLLGPETKEANPYVDHAENAAASNRHPASGALVSLRLCT